MIDPGFTNPKIVQLAKLNTLGQRIYPGVDGSFWHGVYDQGATDFGVYLDIPGGPRFVWRDHLRFRDLPTHCVSERDRLAGLGCGPYGWGENGPQPWRGSAPGKAEP